MLQSWIVDSLYDFKPFYNISSQHLDILHDTTLLIFSPSYVYCMQTV